MPDSPSFDLARSPLELLENVPESTLRRLKQYSGRLATEAVHAMQQRLPFFGDLEAFQAAVVNFVEWMRDPTSEVGYTAQAFELVPQDLTRKIALAQTVDMVRVTMEFFEEVVPMVARNEEQLTALTIGILRYSRDLAFAAAASYARPSGSRKAARFRRGPEPRAGTARGVQIDGRRVRGRAVGCFSSRRPAAAPPWDATRAPRAPALEAPFLRGPLPKMEDDDPGPR